MSKRLVIDLNLRDYKLLHENSRRYNSRIYNYFTLNEIAIAWKDNVDDSMKVLEIKDLLIETHSDKKFSVLYWYSVYMPLRYSLIFLISELF